MKVQNRRGGLKGCRAVSKVVPLRRSYLCVLAAGAMIALSGSACGDDSADEAATEQDTLSTTESKAGGEGVVVGGRVILRADGGLQSPLDGITVVMTSRDGGDDFNATTDDLGHFSLEVPAGTYEVGLEGLSQGQAFEPVRVTVPEGGTSFQVPRLTVH